MLATVAKCLNNIVFFFLVEKLKFGCHQQPGKVD